MSQIKHVGPVEGLADLYDTATAQQLEGLGYTVSVQEQKTGWFEESLWTVFVSRNGSVTSPQTNLNRAELNAALVAIENLAGLGEQSR